MNVKTDPSGRRYVETEFEVLGTPEEVWQAIATAKGFSSWFAPTEVEQRDGKSVAIVVDLGPGMVIRTDITKWDPPRMYATEAPGWIPGSPAMASEWTVEARAGGSCVIRIVQSLFASTDEWDNQLESAKGGFASFLVILRLYLAHFRGQHSAVTQLRAPGGGTDAENWEDLTSSLGLSGMKVGQRFTAPAGSPPLSGVIEYVTDEPFDALLRLDQPAPGVAALGIAGYPGGPSMVAMNLYLYGDKADTTLAEVTPRWEAWLQERFPMPAQS
ncbi:MAG: SRPBCC domain-containing protein [Gemmatimonadota bacterium]